MCSYPGLRSAVGKLMRNGLVEGSLAWNENTEGKVWSGEELRGSKRNCEEPKGPKETEPDTSSLEKIAPPSELEFFTRSN